jgi:hypothetical protein
MSTSSDSTPSVNGTGTTATNDTLDHAAALTEATADWLDQHDSDAPYCPTPEDEAEAAAMFAAMDAQNYLEGTLPGCERTLTLAELVDRQTGFYRGWGTAAGEMIARQMEQLAMAIRWCHAETPADYEARHEIVEQDARETWFNQGFEEGRQKGRSEAGVMADGQID